MKRRNLHDIVPLPIPIEIAWSTVLVQLDSIVEVNGSRYASMGNYTWGAIGWPVSCIAGTAENHNRVFNVLHTTAVQFFHVTDLSRCCVVPSKFLSPASCRARFPHLDFQGITFHQTAEPVGLVKFAKVLGQRKDHDFTSFTIAPNLKVNVYWPKCWIVGLTPHALPVS